MEKQRGILFEALKYLWRRVTGKPGDLHDLTDDRIVDQPHDSAQRRSFVRGSCVYPFRFTPEGGEAGQGAMLNVSGSGMLFLTKVTLPLGTSLRVAGRFYGRDMTFRAKVVRVDPSLDGFEALNAYGAVFTSLAESDRRAIIRAVFGESRHLSQLDLGGDEL